MNGPCINTSSQKHRQALSHSKPIPVYVSPAKAIYCAGHIVQIDCMLTLRVLSYQVRSAQFSSIPNQTHLNKSNQTSGLLENYRKMCLIRDGTNLYGTMPMPALVFFFLFTNFFNFFIKFLYCWLFVGVPILIDA